MWTMLQMNPVARTDNWIFDSEFTPILFESSTWHAWIWHRPPSRNLGKVSRLIESGLKEVHNDPARLRIACLANRLSAHGLRLKDVYPSQQCQCYLRVQLNTITNLTHYTPTKKSYLSLVHRKNILTSTEPTDDNNCVWIFRSPEPSTNIPTAAVKLSKESRSRLSDFADIAWQKPVNRNRKGRKEGSQRFGNNSCPSPSPIRLRILGVRKNLQ
jgi:hypothetical protein